MCSAITRRRPRIGIRSATSVLASAPGGSAPDVPGPDGAEELGAFGGGVEDPAAGAPKSASVIRPPGPEPVTFDRSIPRSLANRRRYGDATTRPAAGVPEAGGGGVAEGGGGPFGGAGAAEVAGAGDFAEGAVPPGSGSMVTSIPPTLTFSPTCAWILAMTPFFGEEISTFALSVSTLTRGASSAIGSPSFTNHWTTSPSATPSPMSGRRNSKTIERS